MLPTEVGERALHRARLRLVDAVRAADVLAESDPDGLLSRWGDVALAATIAGQALHPQDLPRALADVVGEGPWLDCQGALEAARTALRQVQPGLDLSIPDFVLAVSQVAVAQSRLRSPSSFPDTSGSGAA